MFESSNSKWSYPLSHLNTHVYDVCYRFKGTINDTNANNPSAASLVNFKMEFEFDDQQTSLILENVFQVNFNKQYQVDENNQNIVDLCLNQLADLNSIQSDKLKLVVTAKGLGGEIEWEPEASQLYVKPSSVQNNGEYLSFSSLYNASKSTSFTAVPTTFFDISNGLKPVQRDLGKIELFEEPILFMNIFSGEATNTILLFSSWFSSQTDNYLPEQINRNLFQVIENQFPKDSLQIDLSLCKPRSDPTILNQFCVKYKQGEMIHSLSQLQSSVFQLKLDLTFSKPLNASYTAKIDVHMFQPCLLNDVKCQNNSTCSNKETDFQCSPCPPGYSGKLCEISDCKDENKVSFLKYSST